MGLDTVELAMEVEESFGITIPDGRACQMRTVGDLYSFILEETHDQGHEPNSCVTAATFYELRKQLDSHIENANGIRPRSNVDATLPRHHRRILWTQLSREMNLRFPSLCRPTLIVLLACAGVAVPTFVAFFAYGRLVGPEIAVILTALTFALTSSLMTVLTSPFAVLPSSSVQTYRGLVTQLVAMNYAKLSGRYRSWNPTDVWNVLQLIIVEQLGVKKEDVTPDADFVYDLGCD